VIDGIRQDIQQRLDELLAEADKLRLALVALDPRESQRARRSARRAANEPAVRPASRQAAAPASGSRRTRRRAASTASVPARSASGATKAKVLGALSNDGGLTAGEVAKATGLGRASVSTTLSKLAKSGEIAKAQRGYRLSGSAASPDGGRSRQTAGVS
jgi:CRP-like cAMP-binding protein